MGKLYVLAEPGMFPKGKEFVCPLGEHEIALWRVQGRLHAIANTCPHQHISALHSGTVDDRCVTCPMHGWTFSLETGIAVTGNGRIHIYPVREEGEWVEITLPAGAGIDG